MKLSFVQPNDSTSFRNIDAIRKIVQPVSNELSDSHDYYRSELELEGYTKAFGHFNGYLVEGGCVSAAEEGYELEEGDMAFWHFQSENGFVTMYTDGAIEVGDFTDEVGLANEIVALLHKLYAANFSA